jgi:quinol monooxygenase YgiN
MMPPSFTEACMAASESVQTLVIYRPKPGAESALEALVRKHLPTLKTLGLLGPGQSVAYRAEDKRSHAICFVEIFDWKDKRASDVAHQTPEVMAIWEPMGPLLENLEIRALQPL